MPCVSCRGVRLFPCPSRMIFRSSLGVSFGRVKLLGKFYWCCNGNWSPGNMWLLVPADSPRHLMPTAGIYLLSNIDRPPPCNISIGLYYFHNLQLRRIIFQDCWLWLLWWHGICRLPERQCSWTYDQKCEVVCHSRLSIVALIVA